ncbi:cellulase N-terminal Ig-like domain-containing protein [Marinimicrobium sp. ABcell2]|uniref:cellulase N-terminal Ig-like domain-containing protein n=1 Tax=Marinimicrobium sp. ABcell2 TaxID=3069751 RepID=UPI0027AE3BAF|nr:cellulase N-terminal Ig-like domain-containing protein [Marinimicrobium sp. ABcell2]MDQ2077865.1 cellulase N-terminal Ig-like domain-containing protein [Marinimicrobium sp. ABcell2]
MHTRFSSRCIELLKARFLGRAHSGLTGLVRLTGLSALLILVAACSSPAPLEAPPAGSPDDGSQMNNPFRINYAGYLPLQEKVAVYLSESDNPITWELRNANHRAVASGTSAEYRQNDYASGDSFFLIDFSHYTTPGEGYYLVVDNERSHSFDLTNDPYGDLKYEFFDYFRDHRREGDHFNRAVHDWTDHEVTLNFIADAGDQGYYPVNAAEAKWSLINLLETHPEINTYYTAHQGGDNTVYDELVFFASPMYELIFPGEKLAVAKLHTNSADWAPCTGASGEGASCISMPETKATYSVARSLAAMARLHAKYGTEEEVQAAYEYARTALHNAETEDFVCLGPESFGGEGGYYPNNDNWSLWREPREHREPCASGPEADPTDDNVNDDHYAALVEVYLAARQLGHEADARALEPKILAHNHHNRVNLFFWGAVSTEATLSLLTHRPEGLDLSQAEANLFAYSDQVLGYQQVGYPGITFDVQSDRWNSNDRDEVDNNFRWGSNRMQLNEARILMAAADLQFERENYAEAAKYTNGVLRVLDQMSGTNAVALAMYTAADYPHIQHAVTRTHDRAVPDTKSGKFILGPNNWTNSNDPDMPDFGSKPGMKMFALTGTGWASREVAIDANAAILPVVYFATEVAPTYLERAHQ